MQGFEARYTSCCQQVLKTSTGTHPFFNHQQTRKGRCSLLLILSDVSIQSHFINVLSYLLIKASIVLLKMFYSYDVGTGCCVGFNGVFSKLKSTLIC